MKFNEFEELVEKAKLDINLEKYEDLIIESKNSEFCYLFSSLVPNVNLEKMLDQIIIGNDNYYLSNLRKEDPALQGGDEFSHTLLLFLYSIT